MKLFPPSYSYHITIYTLKIIFLENEEHNNIFMKNIMNLVLIFLIILLTSKANSYNLYEFDYSYTSSTNGEILKYDTYEGTPLLIDIFATWCEPCKTEILHLKEIHDKTSDISFLSISIDFISDTLQKLENFKEEFEVDWEFGLDHNDIFSQNFNITVIPSLLLLDETGEILHIWRGLTSVDEISSKLQSELGISIDIIENQDISILINRLIGNIGFQITMGVIILSSIYMYVSRKFVNQI